MNHYFAGNAWGVEYYAGYRTVQITKSAPLLMRDKMQFATGRNYQFTDNGLRISFTLADGQSMNDENTPTPGSDNSGGINLVRFNDDF